MEKTVPTRAPEALTGRELPALELGGCDRSTRCLQLQKRYNKVLVPRIEEWRDRGFGEEATWYGSRVSPKR